MKELSKKEQDTFLILLKSRFDKVPHKISWDLILKRLLDNPYKLWSLYQMEVTGGEPAFIENNDNEYIFYDTCIETPIDRRSLCYDDIALNKRKDNKPINSALRMAKDMDVEILTEEQYRYLQSIFSFDLKTSSWIMTPNDIRELGGALFCDNRYNHVFVYHNGADSYYSSRGFRCCLKV
jgi:hypothetical protein